jgi:predicted metalloprotease with PDZ domain
VSISDAGYISDVLWDSPAFNAGLAPGMTVLGLDGRVFNGQQLKDAITAARTDKAPLTLLVKRVDRIDSVVLDYHDGLKYPSLERIAGRPDRLADLWKAR